MERLSKVNMKSTQLFLKIELLDSLRSLELMERFIKLVAEPNMRLSYLVSYQTLGRKNPLRCYMHPTVYTLVCHLAE